MTATSSFSLRKPRLRLERLEDRTVPALFGQPWSDPEHLTLSFAPDGTSLANQPSTLFRTLDAQMPRAVWQRAVLQAFQTWAGFANINLGVVADSGDPFGAAGRTQGDLRFGDIRIGAQPLSPDALAVAIPHDPLLSGTWTGDVFLNSNARFTPATLTSVLTHEAGHVFGLDESNNPRSIMYPRLVPTRSFTPQDAANLQALYGARTADLWDQQRPNDAFANATRIKVADASEPFDGKTPLVTFGDVTTIRDADTYWFTPMPGYTGPVTVRLQTAGLSLLAPSLTLYDAAGRVISTGFSADPRGGVVTLRLPQVSPAARYYLRVQGATRDVFGVGRYAVVLTFDRLVQTTPAQLDAFLRQAPSSVGHGEAGEISDPEHALLNADAGTNDTAETALKLTPATAAGTHFEALGSLGSAADVDFYRIRAPQAAKNQTFVLVVSLNSTALNGVVPQVTLLDAKLAPLPAQVLINGNGTFTVQAAGLAGNKDVYLRVASAAGATGNYQLQADFGGRALQARGFAIGSLTAAQPARSYQLFLGFSQLMQFTLSANSTVAGSTSAVRLDLRDAQGQLVRSLLVHGGETMTGEALFLPPGAYSVTVTLVPGLDGRLDPMSYRLLGISMTNPIGPAVVNPLLTPQYVSPNDPTVFLYPGAWSTPDAYFWVLLDPAGYLVIPGPNGTTVHAYPVINGVPQLTPP